MIRKLLTIYQHDLSDTEIEVLTKLVEICEQHGVKSLEIHMDGPDGPMYLDGEGLHDILGNRKKNRDVKIILYALQNDGFIDIEPQEYCHYGHLQPDAFQRIEFERLDEGQQRSKIRRLKLTRAITWIFITLIPFILGLAVNILGLVDRLRDFFGQ